MDVGKLFVTRSESTTIDDPWYDWFAHVEEQLPRLLSHSSYRAWAKERRPGEQALLEIINAGTYADLLELPFKGKDPARRIQLSRGKRPFRSIAELARISGVGEATLDELYAYAKARFSETNR
jgi:hypothetical protein